MQPAACVVLRQRGCARRRCWAIGPSRAERLGIVVASGGDSMTPRSLLAAGLYLVPAALFTEIARQQWVFRRHRSTTGRLFRSCRSRAPCRLHYGVLVARASCRGAVVEPDAGIATRGTARSRCRGWSRRLVPRPASDAAAREPAEHRVADRQLRPGIGGARTARASSVVTASRTR
jgi:hypothetical protein